MERLGIAELAQRHIRSLSGGQQQRVFLARAMTVRPELLVLDEPTAGVDMHTQEDILHLLAALNRDGMTIVVTTHDLNAAASHLPRIVCMNKTIIADGPPEAVFTPETLNATYRGDMIVLRQNGLIFVQERPHKHSYVPDVDAGLPPSVVPPATDIPKEVKLVSLTEDTPYA
jgi:ABC-type Mn2+/Zn2+ transport system ATPase subunit